MSRASDDEEDERLTILPDLTDGEPLDLLGLSSEQHFTQPPPRFTEATLIRALEERGIGRPSTYAPTIETIRQRGYVIIKDRRLFPEESAFRVTDLLVEHFPEIVDLDFTARMEDQLDDVARGEHEWVPMVREFWIPFSAKVIEGKEKIAKQVEVTDIPCPLTGDKGDMLVKRFGRNGWFLGCAGYPECKYTQPLPGEEPEDTPELPGVGEVCPLCNQGHLVGEARADSAHSWAATATPSASTSRRTRPRPASSSAPVRSAARGRWSPSGRAAAAGRSGAAIATPTATTRPGPARPPPEGATATDGAATESAAADGAAGPDRKEAVAGAGGARG